MKRAVLVGCNYPGTNAKLNGCVNDVRTVEALLKEYYGFSDADITILVDADARSGETTPTGKNIKAALKTMVSEAKPGDVLVFHFSGHGTQIPSEEVRPEELLLKGKCKCMLKHPTLKPRTPPLPFGADGGGKGWQGRSNLPY
eukprot:scaffold336_cov384-Prasinococcus_capsulatus_cf.AAC.26